MTTDLTTYEHDIFLSYNKADEDWTGKLAARLEQEDWQGRKLKVFFAPWDIRPGQSIPREIEKGLQTSRKVAIVWSPEAAASVWVELERLVITHIAVSSREERLIPLIRRSHELPPLLQHILSIDFTDDSRFEASYKTLLAVVKDEPLPRVSNMPPEKLVPPPASLPRPPVVGFVTRRDETERDIVQRLRDELTPEKNQLVALWGAGGVGKTTLAAEAVRGINTTGQRVIWVSADGRTNFTLSTLLDDIAEQLGRTDLRPLAIEQKDAAVRALIADAPALIVLDNFETISPADQPLCVDFLAQRARCPVLITTREWIANVNSISLHRMRLDEANDFLDRLISQTRDPGIYAEVNRARIFETAEYNPLIIQWIVGQINLAQDPEEVLDELAHGEGSAAHRVFDRSFNLPQMAEGGRAVLLALSLFMPSATRPALAEVAGMSKDKNRKKFKKAQQTLASLWLLNPTDGGQRLAVEGLTRDLAKARLSRDPRSKTFRPRFIARFLQYAEANSKTSTEHLNSIEAEKDNILNAIDVASESKEWESMLRITSACRDFLHVRGYWDEAIGRGEEALRVARNSADVSWIGGFAHTVALTYQNRGDLTKARRLYDESLEIARKLGDQHNIAATLHQLAILAHNHGEFDEARRLYDESLEIARKLGDQTSIAASLHQLAMLAQDKGELDEARRLYDESLEVWKRVGDQNNTAATLHQLAMLAHNHGELDEARRLYDESLGIRKRLGNLHGIAFTLHHLAMLAQDEGELDEARQMYDESLEIAKKLGDQTNIAATLHQLGTLSLAEGEFQEAGSLLEQSLLILRKVGDKRNIAECLGSMGNLKATQGAFSEAHNLFDDALRTAQALPDKFRIASVKRSQGLLAEKEDDRVGSAQLLGEALNIFSELGSPKAEDTRRDLERVEGRSS